MTKKLHKINIPIGFSIVKNEFYDYDPETEYNEKNQLYYLQEDLIQLIFDSNEILIDLGWYGDTTEKEGGFKIYVIQYSNWDKPILEVSTKSGIEIKNELNRILEKVSKGIIKHQY